MRFSLCCIAILILLVGCSSKHQSVSSPTQLILNETVMYPTDSPPEIKVKQNHNQWLEISTTDYFPSPPAISEDRLKLAYIAPFEFEMVGELWLYTLGQQSASKVIDASQLPTNQSIKKILWIDHEYLVYVTGYALGTIASNYSVFLFNINNQSSQLLYEVGVMEHIEHVVLSNPNVITLTIQTYNEDMTHYLKTEEVELTLPIY